MLVTAAMVVAFTMPPVDYSARRLILVRAGSSPYADALVAHIADTHGDDVRFMLTSSDSDAIELANEIDAVVSPKMVGRLSISQTDVLRGQQDGETAEECAERAIQAREYALRGTMEGAASIIISHEDVMQFILARAADLKSEMSITRGTLPDCTVSVLDFGFGSFPDVVADELPVVHEQWNPAMAT
jgi:broad specificity phosphatase PhoE